MVDGDSAFSGSIPALYDRHLGPFLFEPYAADLVVRLADVQTGALLETAAGTGIVTQALAHSLSASVELVATDLNQAMIDFAAKKPGVARVAFRQADALALPFETDRFDAVVCQFGAMFFPDRVTGYREARRVLKSGGQFVLSIWDSLAHNPIARCVVDAAARHLPANPPRFLARTPHGHSDQAIIRRELAEAGFTQITLEVVALPSRASSHRDPAIGFCQGSPMRGEIEAQAPRGLQEATDAVANAVAAEFGAGPIESTMQAIVIVARK